MMFLELVSITFGQGREKRKTTKKELVSIIQHCDCDRACYFFKTYQRKLKGMNDSNRNILIGPNAYPSVPRHKEP